MNLDSQRVPRYFQRGMVECVGGNSRTNKRDPITIEKLTRRFANRFDSIRVTAKGSKGIVYIDIDIDIYIGSRRPEVAGQLISHFFDEVILVIRGVPFAAIQVVITSSNCSHHESPLQRIVHRRKETRSSRIKQECRPTFWSGERLPRFRASSARNAIKYPLLFMRDT